ncbi:MAG: DUF1850 domain-containing protein [Spirochaetaceae bacterium]|jgi:hypothetical protein|nr:DUF1850 domain-containing protein [Spirochaetaceae bacterium]
MLRLFLALAVLALTYQFVPRGLAIGDADSGKVYLRRPLQKGETFAIEFIHSVNNSPVRETFTADQGRIRPVSSRFASFGAGIQSDLAEGQTLSREGGFLVISGFQTSYKELLYIVGTVSDHILYLRDERISLRDLCGRNAHIRIWTHKGIFL